jgi:hypothetical protein
MSWPPVDPPGAAGNRHKSSALPEDPFFRLARHPIYQEAHACHSISSFPAFVPTQPALQGGFRVCGLFPLARIARHEGAEAITI